MNRTRESISTKAPYNSTSVSEALRFRYHALLEKYEWLARPSERAWLIQKAINFAIFCALFIAILTVFGIGLSWFNSASRKGGADQTNRPATKSTGAEAQVALPQAPAQPAGPAGHAEVRSQSAPEKKTGGE